MMKYRIAVIAFLLLFTSLCFAEGNDLGSLVQSLLQQNNDYRQALAKFRQEKAKYTIDRSLSIFDMNFFYKQYDNDFTRNDIDTSPEHSTVDEKDKRWGFELSKQLFAKDFDSEQDAITSRFNLLRYAQEIRILHTTAFSDILDDLISWFEADQKAEFLKKEINLLYNQNLILESLVKENHLEPDKLIKNLEDIDSKENDLLSYQTESNLMNRKYGNILPAFMSSMKSYINTGTEADTVSFHRSIEREIQLLKKETDILDSKVNGSYYHFFLPEINLKLSYNWRENRQNWDTTENSVLKKLIRNQDEEYPEGDLEISLPFNFLSNAHGKLSLLKSYKMELSYRSSEMSYAWQKLGLERLNQYHAAELRLQRRSRLNELYEATLALQLRKLREEPLLLGDNPSLKIDSVKMKAEESRVDKTIAEMRLYKEIFLINQSREEIQ